MAYVTITRHGSYTPTHSATLSDLPKELLPNIFFHLTPSEIPKVSLTCHKWLDASKNEELKKAFFKQAMQDKLAVKEVCYLAWSEILNKSQEYTNISLLCLKALNLAPKLPLGKKLPFRTNAIVEFGKFFSEQIHPDSTFVRFRKLKMELEKPDETCPYTQFIKGVWCLSRAIRGEIVSEEDLKQELWQTTTRGIEGKNLLEAASAAGIADADYFLAMYAPATSEEENVEEVDEAEENFEEVDEDEDAKEDSETIHLKMIKDAATKGSLLAYHSLTMLGMEGVQGLENYELYQRSAAEAGHVHWQLSLGAKLIRQEKYEEAVEWIGRAAMQNDREAKLMLVNLKARGAPGAESYLNQLKADGLDFIMGDDGKASLKEVINTSDDEISFGALSATDDEFSASDDEHSWL